MGIVSVEDNGPPLSNEALETIFSAFGRAHDRPGQTDSVGLGLTVSRQLARMMGGEITYHHDGRWGSFRLSLPMAVSETTSAIFAAPATASAVHKVGTA
jgi:signal transduction histidine kinase